MMMRILPFLTLAVILLNGCSNPRESLGLSKNAPDEFKVVKNAPLEMPPSYSLPVPRPGAPRPQETEVTKQAKAVLLGQADESTSQSQGEAALLQQAGAAGVDDDIRMTIDSEGGQVDESAQSVAKRLLGIGDDLEDANVIDAKVEAERLEKLKNAN